MFALSRVALFLTKEHASCWRSEGILHLGIFRSKGTKPHHNAGVTTYVEGQHHKSWVEEKILQISVVS